ncbi:hypothetical protein [Bradyrhizobium liaoningense]|uniref:hypothetical protein n=1 Tax=Bradyrhizobium liaoningense TaxID=43992 RepID=UPI001BACD5F1|nr:hypothetical protein [Bradyrhizobium liaoningense]MBR0719113.1 hypothetical protein [Bradyrhizobium liaoningense]
MSKRVSNIPQRMPLEELAVDLLFEALGEDRYNRSMLEYAYLISLIPPLKEAIHLVNQRLQQLNETGQQRFSAICYFKSGDLAPRYVPFPSKISIETLRMGLLRLGFRTPKWRKSN